MLEVFMIVVGALSLVAWACDAYTRRKRPNRRVTLPPPSEQCRRAPDWRSQALSGRYW